jgi:hypothetical protein
MSNDNKPKDKNEPVKTATMDGPAAMQTAPKDPAVKPTTPRFVAAGIDADGYEGARLRRLEPYQAFALKIGLQKLGVKTDADVLEAIKKPAVKKLVCQFIGGSLVGPEMKNSFGETRPAKLIRKAARGALRIADDLTNEQLASVAVSLIKQADVWKSKRS